MKLLIADDSLLVRNTIKRLLKAMEMEHISVLEAKNGREALDIYEKELPDAIIVDLLMPEIDGEGVLSQLQELKKELIRNSELKQESTHNHELEHQSFIAVLSSNVQEPVKRRCIAMGADIFIEKPITHEKMKYFFIKMEKMVSL